MYVRWQRRDERRRTTIRFVYMVPTADEYAVLVESVRVNGEPRQRHVAYLGSTTTIRATLSRCTGAMARTSTTVSGGGIA